MEFQIIVSLFSLLFPLTIFLFFRNVLDNKAHNRISLIIAIALLLIGIASFVLSDNFFYLSLIIPLISLLIYKASLNIFVKKHKRVPLDTFFDWSSGLLHDRIFSIVFLILGLILPFIASLLLIDNLKNARPDKANQLNYKNESISKGDSFTIAKCTFIDNSNIEDFAFYEFYVKGDKIKGIRAIEKGSGDSFLEKHFEVNYSSLNPLKSTLLIDKPVSDITKIKAAGFE